MQEKVILYLRILISTSLLAVWCFWLVNLPNSSEDRSKEVEKQEVEKQEVEKQEVKKPASQKEKQISKVQNLKKTDLPKLAKLEVQQIINSKNTQIVQKTLSSPQAVKLNLPQVAEATREILKESTKQSSAQNMTTSQEILLREKVHIEHKQDEDELAISWIPRYIKEKKELNNFDLIASQLEVTGLIKDLEGQDAAIIKNKENNMIEILKVGDEYLGLKLSEIQENKVILIAPFSNKTYTKEVITSIP